MPEVTPFERGLDKGVFSSKVGDPQRLRSSRDTRETLCETAHTSAINRSRGRNCPRRLLLSTLLLPVALGGVLLTLPIFQSREDRRHFNFYGFQDVAALR